MTLTKRMRIPPTRPNTNETAMRLSRIMGPIGRVSARLHIILRESVGRIDRVGARADVVFPSVHRARHDGAVELAFADRTAAVQTDVRERIEPSVDVEEGDRMALHDDDATATGRHVRRLRDADERDHRACEPCPPDEDCDKFYDGHAAWKD